MGSSDRNEGVIQSGGTINVGGAFAVGQHATSHSQAGHLTVSSNERGWQEIADKL